MKRRSLTFMLGAIALGLVTGGIPPEGETQDMPCVKEIQTFCADVQPGGGRILQCLKGNEQNLSAPCLQRMHDLEAGLSGALFVCRDDWVAYCYHPRAAGGESMLQCLQANQARVVIACQKALEGAGGMRRQPRAEMP